MTPLLVAAAYFLPAALIRWGLAKAWLRPFGADDVRPLLWWSWGWSCLVAPLGWWLTEIGAYILPKIVREAVAVFWLAGIIRVFVPYFVLCFAFDWWLAMKRLGPRDGVERKRIALWVWTANLAWSVWWTGLFLILLWLLTQALRNMD